jgi:hypothetical protein
MHLESALRLGKRGLTKGSSLNCFVRKHHRWPQGLKKSKIVSVAGTLPRPRKASGMCIFDRLASLIQMANLIVITFAMAAVTDNYYTMNFGTIRVGTAAKSPWTSPGRQDDVERWDH